jgi:DNA replication protein DnaC
MRETVSARLGQAKKDGLDHEEFLGLMLQDELDFRKSAKIKNLLKRAAFKQPASLEEFDLGVNRALDKKQLRDLGTCRFIDDGINVLILGPTGVGKTYLASAIGNGACRVGHSTLFFRMNSLIEQMLLARAKGTYLNMLKRLAGADLLILDDFGIKPLDPQHFQDLYDVIDERGEDKSTIITTQVPVENWNEIISDPVTCEAITDRLNSGAMQLVMKGASYRPKRSPKAAKLDKH